MRDAAVGFQCPDCVRTGARSTRSGRTAYGGARVANPGLTSLVLIGLNAAVWLLITATGGAASVWVARLSLIPGSTCARGQLVYPQATEAQCNGFGTWVMGVSDGAWWQLVTSMFTHVDLMHIGFNMLALWVLGPQLEMALGRARFLALYLLSGLGGSLVVYWLAPAYTSTLGASGAVFGLMAALLVLALKLRGDVQSILVWIGINAAITVIGRGAISWQGHLGGFVGGLLLMALFAFAPAGARRNLWQGAGLAAYVVVLVLLLALRTAALT
jgi:membrane associated rhomboid family serine protease